MVVVVTFAVVIKSVIIIYLIVVIKVDGVICGNCDSGVVVLAAGIHFHSLSVFAEIVAIVVVYFGMILL